MTVYTLTNEEKNARLAPFANMRLYSLTELQEILGVSHRTLQQYVLDGRVKAMKVGGRWKVTHEEIKRITTEGTYATGEAIHNKTNGNKKKRSK